MNILLVSSYLPYPLFSGGHVRLFNLLKQLSKSHEITLVCEKRTYQTRHDIDEVKKFCKEIFVVERKKQWSPQVIFQTATSGYPFLLAGHDVPKMKKILTGLLQKNTYDLIHVETFYVFQNLPTTSVPTVLVEHNIEYQVYQRFVQHAPLLVRPFLQIDIEKIKYWEKYFWKKATKVVGVSPVEAQKMRSDAVVVPNGVSLVDFPCKPIRLASSAQSKKEKTILFMGDFKWIQNTNSALWILKEIWPKIELRIKNKELRIKLWIVGKHIPESIKKFASKNIIIDEHAPAKTSDIYKKADILLASIRVGGGTSYKILEAMASGVPVVTTHLGIEGLRAQNNEAVLTGETSDGVAECAVHVLEDKKLYGKLAANARKLIEQEYSWEKITQILEGVYKDAIRK